MVVLLEGCHISTEELWSSVRLTIGFLVTSLTKALLLIAQFGWAASSRKDLGPPKWRSGHDRETHKAAHNWPSIFRVRGGFDRLGFPCPIAL
jgi:hypothetical protein